MSIEDFALRFEGIDPARVKQSMDDLVAVLNSAKQIAAALQVQMTAVQTQMPRIERLIDNVETIIKQYEANQRRFGG